MKQYSKYPTTILIVGSVLRIVFTNNHFQPLVQNLLIKIWTVVEQGSCYNINFDCCSN